MAASARSKAFSARKMRTRTSGMPFVRESLVTVTLPSCGRFAEIYPINIPRACDSLYLDLTNWGRAILLGLPILTRSHDP